MRMACQWTTPIRRSAGSGRPCWRHASLAALVGLALTALAARAVADEAPPPPPADDDGQPANESITSDDLAPSLPPPRLPPISAPPGTRRAVPDFQGPRPESPSAGQVLVWVPRVVLLPAYVVFEGVIRQPLVLTTRAIEEHHVLDWVKYLLLWRGGRSGLLPTFIYDFGLSPSVGFFVFHDDAFGPGQYLTVQGGFWTGGWTSVQAQGGVRVLRDGSGLVSFNAQFVDRPDRVFFGVGPLTSQADLQNFRQAVVDTSLRFRATLAGPSRLSFWAGYRHSTFGRGREPSVTLSEMERLPGWGGYQLALAGAVLELDSRDPDRLHAGGSGVRLEARGTFAIDPSGPAPQRLHFLRWGGEAGGFLDFTGANHVLGLRAYVEMLEQTGPSPVPFTELIALGGPLHLQGFLDGRFRGASALVVTAEYRWPVWALLDATVFLSAGNVFSEHLRDLTPAHVYLSWGAGLRSSFSRHVSADLLVAFGTNRLDSPIVGVDSVRALFAISRGF
jgi:hypothetical protein